MAGAAPGQGLEQFIQAPGGNGDEQSAGGLGVESQVDRRLVHAGRHAQRAAHILAVALNRARNHALAQGLHRAVEGRQRTGVNFRAESSRPQHPPQMGEEAEAGDVRAGRRARLLHRFRRAPVERGHGKFRRRQAGGIIAADLAAKDEHAGAQRLGEDERVTGLWFIERGGHGGIDQSRDGKAEFDFVILDTVSAEEGDAGFLENLHRPGEHKINDFARQFFRGKGEHAQGGARLAAHRVNVGEAVGRADSAEKARVVHARGEDVHGLHEAKIAGDAVNGRVIGGGQSANHGRVFDRREAGQGRVQVGGGDLGGAAGVAGELRQFDLRRLQAVGPLAGAGTEILFAEQIAGARTPHVADAMSQALGAIHHEAAFGKVNFHGKSFFGPKTDFVKGQGGRATTPGRRGAPSLPTEKEHFVPRPVFWPPRPASGCCRSGL